MAANTVIAPKKKKSSFREYTEALLTAVLFAMLIRSFVIEAFKIPSGSMIPTLSVGDHIFVNKFVYGLRIPLTKFRLVEFREPRRGEVVVFIYPVDEGKDYIKRVIGLPGDRLRIEGEDVWVNGERFEKKPLQVAPIPGDGRRLAVEGGRWRTIPASLDWEAFDLFSERVDAIEHLVQYERGLEREGLELVVPPGHYFMMGDNRDNSADSREWGFVPAENIKGKAMFVWLPLDKDHGGIRWHEFGRWIE